MSLRVLVTGGAGFIGSHLVARLVAEIARVRVLDDLSSGCPNNLPPGIELIVGNVADLERARQAAHKTDAMCHLAAISSVARAGEDGFRAHQVNAAGTVAILEIARRPSSGISVPVIYASSAAVYGDNPSQPLDETFHLQPISAYGGDKLADELHARVATEIHSVPRVSLRFFNVYGPLQDPSSPHTGVISSRS